MSSCLSGGGDGGRAYRLESPDLEMIKSPPSTSWISNSSSTLSESSNAGSLAISTRKPRTPRKRPNQTCNEAAAILSTAHPKIFPTNNMPTKSPDKDIVPFPFDPSDLLVPFQTTRDASGFLLHRRQGSDSSSGPKGTGPVEKACVSPGEVNSKVFGLISNCCGYENDLDAKSIILDHEEIGEGIGRIMGQDYSGIDNVSTDQRFSNSDSNDFVCGYDPVGRGFEFEQCGMRREIRAMRGVDEGDWWRFPSVNVFDLINPRVERKEEEKKQSVVETKSLGPEKEKFMETKSLGPEKEKFINNGGLLLKLNYDGVLDAWSDKASPFSGECPGAEVAGNGVQARLAQIDLFSDNGGIREASVLRYKEKRRNRLFSNKIRYQVRKINADRRPRMKGRFIRTPNSSDD